MRHSRLRFGQPPPQYRACVAFLELVERIGRVDDERVADDARGIIVDVIIIVGGDEEDTFACHLAARLVELEDRHFGRIVIIAVGSDDDMIVLNEHLIVPIGTLEILVPPLFPGPVRRQVPIDVGPVGKLHRLHIDRKDPTVLQNEQIVADLLDDIALVNASGLDVRDRRRRRGARPGHDNVSHATSAGAVLGLFA